MLVLCNTFLAWAAEKRRLQSEAAEALDNTVNNPAMNNPATSYRRSYACESFDEDLDSLWV